VRDTLPDTTGQYGDAFGVATFPDPAELTVTNSVADATSRAAVLNFGAKVTLQATHLQCQLLDLDGEQAPNAPYQFVDQGGNLCGCPAATEQCRLVSTGLGPPTALPPLDE